MKKKHKYLSKENLASIGGAGAIYAPIALSNISPELAGAILGGELLAVSGYGAYRIHKLGKKKLKKVM